MSLRWPHASALAAAAASVLAACGPDRSEVRRDDTKVATAANDGIECLRYGFAADAPRIEAVAASFATRPFPGPDLRTRLAAQGLQAAIVRTSDLDQVKRRLGPLTEVHHFPIGQTPTWLPVARRDLGPGERITLPSAFGRTQVAGSVLRLSVRSWLLPDADAGCVHVEVMVHAAGPETPITATAGEPPAGTPFTDTRIECRIAEGETLLLLPCPPAPTGKGPATSADLPPTPGLLLLGESARPPQDAAARGASTVVAICAHVPATMRPPPMPAVDSGAPIADTTDPDTAVRSP